MKPEDLLFPRRDQSSPEPGKGQLEEKYRRLAEASSDAILIHLNDRIAFANRSGIRLLGASNLEELFGRHLLDFVHLDDHQKAKNMVQSGLGKESRIRTVEARLIRLDGREILAQIASVPTPQPNTSMVRLTERGLGEVSIRPTSDSVLESYSRLFEEFPQAAYVCTLEGKVLDINPAGVRLFGFDTKEEICKLRTIRELWADPALAETFQSLLKNQGSIEAFEHFITRRDGQKVHVVETGNVVRAESSNVIVYRGFVQDVTELKVLEQQLLQAQKAESLGELIGGIAHDFNNILNNVNGFVHQLKKYPHDPQRVLKYSDTIEKSASRGVGLAMQLLSFIRHKQREIGPVRLEDIIDEVVLLANETFPRKITIRKQVDQDLFPVIGDRGELYQALLNILLNARDAMRGGGILEVIATNHVSRGLEPEPDVNYVQVRVSDTGTGIPTSIQDKIFDPFFTTKENGTGTGLGLSIVFNIVKNHRGTIVAKSEIGKGTTFTMNLPAIQTQDVVDDTTESIVPRSGKNEVILLVDDESTMQELGKELLQEHGYRVLVARDGLEAVEVYRQHSKEISLVILDLMMPGMDGGQAYEELKRINGSIKAFFCTGYTSTDYINALTQEKELRSLQKPFRPLEFVKTVREVLDED